MNIIKFWKEVSAKFNQDNKCGFCWAFGGALEESAIETYQIRKGEECCVHFFLTDLRWETINEYDEVSGRAVRIFCDYNFTLWALVPSQLGINNYNEIPSHSVDESAWETIVEPLRECLTCDDMIYICEVLGYPVRVERWASEMVLKKFSNNFDGLRIEGQFRVVK